MRNKITLAMQEQGVMLLVFALCLKAFFWADSTGRQNAERDRAVLYAQTAVEKIMHVRGDLEKLAGHVGALKEETWAVTYDENWKVTDTDVVYCLTAVLAEPLQQGLGKATVTVTYANGEEFFSVPVAWQEVDMP